MTPAELAAVVRDEASRNGISLRELVRELYEGAPLDAVCASLLGVRNDEPRAWSLAVRQAIRGTDGPYPPHGPALQRLRDTIEGEHASASACAVAHALLIRGER